MPIVYRGSFRPEEYPRRDEGASAPHAFPYPSFDMPLTLAQQKAVSQYLKNTASPPQCPVCGASNLRVQPEVVRLPYHGSETDDYPVVMVECQYCAHLLHFSPKVMGLPLEAPSTDEDSENQGPAS